MADSLDRFLAGVLTQDTKKRIETGEELCKYLQTPNTSITCDDMDKLVDGLALWVNSSSFKVSLLGLDVIQCLIVRMKSNFRPYITSVLSATIDRLGDSKDQVRDSAKKVLLSLMVPASNPQYVIERLTPAFSHKLWKVKEESLSCVQFALNEWGARSMIVSKLVPIMVKLMDDASVPVRDKALQTLVEFYRHVGERIRQDLCKRDIAPSKLSLLISKMDDAKNKGFMVVSFEDEPDNVVQPTLKKGPRSNSTGRSQGQMNRIPTVGVKGLALAPQQQTGALDEELFYKSFEDVPKIFISSAKDLTDRMNRVKDTLADPNKDWEKRQEALKTIRSLIAAGATAYPEFPGLLKSMGPAIRVSVLDLRSQIVREACITLGYLSQELGKEFDQMAEFLLPALIQLLPNSAKIMASSGLVALRFIVQNTQSHRLIPLVTCNLVSKSNVIRRHCCDLLEQITRTWTPVIIERQLTHVVDAIKKGLSDADLEARAITRRAYWNFEENFKMEASTLYASLDSTQQKALATAAAGVGSGSSSSSSTSSVNVISNSASTRTLPGRCTIRSVSGSRVPIATAAAVASDSTKPPTNVKPSRLPQRATADFRNNVQQQQHQQQQQQHDDNSNMLRTSSTSNVMSTTSPKSSLTTTRTISKIARPTYNVQSLRHSQSSTDLSTPTKQQQQQTTSKLRRNASMRMPSRSNRSSPSQQQQQQQHSPRNRNSSRSPRIGMSLSQPSSRSVSPSSRYSYITQQQQQPQQLPRYSTAATRQQQQQQQQQFPMVTPVPPSRVPMREPSPARSDAGIDMKKKRISVPPMRVPIRDSLVPSEAPDNYSSVRLPTRVVKQYNNNNNNNNNYNYNMYNNNNNNNNNLDDGDVSETSSLTSDASARSYNSEDMSLMIRNLSSLSWQDRKNALLMLNAFFTSHRFLSQQELKQVVNAFTKCFFDNNNKVFSVFLDTLALFLAAHKSDLGTWLNICLPQLLNKLGNEISPSIQEKILKCLDLIRVFTPGDQQFAVLNKYIVDQVHASSMKSKLALLNYMQELTLTMTSDDVINTSDMRLAVTRIITWSTEPKSPEIRKSSQMLFVKLYQLNPNQFNTILDVLPKTFKTSAKKILQDQQYTLNDEILSSYMTTTTTTATTTLINNNNNNIFISSSDSSSSNNNNNNNNNNFNANNDYGNIRRSLSSPSRSTPTQQLLQQQQQLPQQIFSTSPALKASNSENINPYFVTNNDSDTNNINNNNNFSMPTITTTPSTMTTTVTTTSDNFSPYLHRHSYDNNDNNNNNCCNNASSSPSNKPASSPNNVGDSLNVAGYDFNKFSPNVFVNSTLKKLQSDCNDANKNIDNNYNNNNNNDLNISNININDNANSNNNDSNIINMGDDVDDYFQDFHDSDIHKNLYDITAGSLLVNDKDDDEHDFYQADEIDHIIQVLASKDDDQYREVKLLHLVVVARDRDNLEVWQHHFKTILMLLLDILSDPNANLHIRSIWVIKEMCKYHGDMMAPYAELVLSKLVEAAKDTNTQKSLEAQDTIATLTSVLPLATSLSLLDTYMRDRGDVKIRYMAYHTQYKLIENITDKLVIKSILPTVVPGLLRGYDDTMSAVRKESVFTLVKLYLVVGDDLKPYLKDMPTSKMKLLNLYIKRALVDKDHHHHHHHHHGDNNVGGSLSSSKNNTPQQFNSPKPTSPNMIG